MNPDSHEPRFSRSEREAETEEPQTSQVIRKYWKCKSGGHPKLKPECAGFLIDLIWIISRTRPSTVTIAFVVVQLLNCVWLFATLWTAACQAPLSITNSQSLLKLMSIHRVSEATQPSHPLHPLLLLPSIYPISLSKYGTGRSKEFLGRQLQTIISTYLETCLQWEI